ncbi:MAG: MATE family efflux transporter [Lachnospiraceae bacterium]|nr:MATE family efflux transporter [Lachnospiraceae bacterium]
MMEEKGGIRSYLGTADFYIRVGGIALPIALQSLIQIGVNMMDTVMLGTLGETALSASALANQFITIYHICCMGIGMGASVLVSRFWGSKDIPSLKKAVTIMLRLCIGFGLIFALLTALFPGQIMRIYTPENEVIREGIRYFFWAVPAYVLLGVSLDLTLVLRSIGRATVPLVCSMIGFGSNLFFNWVFIFGKLGAPRMEVAGASLGTFLARLIECLLIGGYFFFAEKNLKYRLRDLFLHCGELIGEYLRISIPVLISDALMAFGNSAVAIVMGHIGAAFVSANSITTVTQQLTTVLTQGIAQAGCIVTGHTLGRGERDRAQREAYTFMIFGAMLGLIAGGIILLIREPVIGMYNIEEGTREIARQLMNAIAFILMFQSTNSIMMKGVLRGGGDTRFLMLADVLFLWVASVPLGILAGLVLHLPAFWIYFAMKIDQIIKCLWSFLRLRSGKWIKAIRPAQADG